MQDHRKISGMDPSRPIVGNELIEVIQRNSETGAWENKQIPVHELMGPRGEDGESAYQIAVARGFRGDVHDFIASLVGPQGPEGPKGDTGLSAYQAAVKRGFRGTEGQWLASLKAPDAFETARNRGYVHTFDEWLALIAQYGGTNQPGAGPTENRTATRQHRKVTLANNGAQATLVLVAWGTQDQLDQISVGHSSGSLIQISDVPEGLILESVSLAYGQGFNTDSQFALRYPEPFGEEDTLAMNIPVFYQFSHGNPPTLQPMTQQSYFNDAGWVTCQKVGLVPGRGYHWKFYLY